MAWLNIWSINKVEADATLDISDSYLLIKLLTHIKQGLQKYCKTAYSRSGIDQMWILKNSKELLEHLKSPNFNLVTSIKSLDFSTRYTTILCQTLKAGLQLSSWTFSLKKKSWFGKQGHWRWHNQHARVSSRQHFRCLRGKVFQQIVGIPIDTNCAPLLDDIFLYSYEAEFIQSLLSAGKKQ